MQCIKYCIGGYAYIYTNTSNMHHTHTHLQQSPQHISHFLHSRLPPQIYLFSSQYRWANSKYLLNYHCQHQQPHDCCRILSVSFLRCTNYHHPAQWKIVTIDRPKEIDTNSHSLISWNTTWKFSKNEEISFCPCYLGI